MEACSQARVRSPRTRFRYHPTKATSSCRHGDSRTYGAKGGIVRLVNTGQSRTNSFERKTVPRQTCIASPVLSRSLSHLYSVCCTTHSQLLKSKVSPKSISSLPKLHRYEVLRQKGQRSESHS